jgi:hypothetical protein
MDHSIGELTFYTVEGSLEDLDPFVIDINRKITALDDEISKTVQSQSVVGRQASKVSFRFCLSQLFDTCVCHIRTWTRQKTI